MPARRIDAKSLPSGSILADLLARNAVSTRAVVTIDHDGKRIEARAGEPVAVSLAAAGRTTLARSVKFHRPRGPSCMRGACEGCLTRVDGVPNVMACRVPAREGTTIISQNAFPSASMDVLRVTDWFFPKHFDHHHLMVRWGRALNSTMQVFARRMAGLGTIPEEAGNIVPPDVRECDVLVVGAGVAGLACVAHLASRGLSVECVEESDRAGGMVADGLEWLEHARTGARVSPTAYIDALAESAVSAGGRLHTRASACATFDNGTLVMTPERAMLVRARARVFANGCHEQIGTFENNDLPGVYTARAAAVALANGVLLGDRVVIAGAAWPARGLASAMQDAGATVTVLEGARVEGVSGRAGSLTVTSIAEGGAKKKLKCDVLLVAGEPTPAYELAGQSGAAVRPVAGLVAFAPETNDDGLTDRDGVYAIGSVTGEREALGPIDPDLPLAGSGRVLSRAARLADRIASRLGKAPR